MGHLGKLTKVNEAIQLYVNFLTKLFCSLGDIFLSIGSQSQHYWSGKSIVRLVLRLLLCIYVMAKLVTGILQCHIQDEPLKLVEDLFRGCYGVFLGKLTKVNQAIKLYVSFLTKFFWDTSEVFWKTEVSEQLSSWITWYFFVFVENTYRGLFEVSLGKFTIDN